MAEWAHFHRSDGDEAPERTPGVDRIEGRMRLRGGHPSMYPTASLGANLMIGMALNIFRGRTSMPRGLEISVLSSDLEELLGTYIQ